MTSTTLIADLADLAHLAPASPAPGRAYRPVSVADRDQLAALYLASYPPGAAVADLAEARADIDATFAGEYGSLWEEASLVAVDGPHLRGSIQVVRRSPWDPDLHCPFVIELFVAPSARRVGIGTALLGLSARTCRAAHEQQLALRTGDGTSDAAYRLYARAGLRALSP